MCFSPSASLCSGIIGLILAKYHSTGKRYASRDVAYFYSLMEFLQFVQYSLVDNCNSLNSLLTVFAHCLIVVQPAMWNLFRIRINNKNLPVFDFALKASIVWAIFFTLRLLPIQLGAIPLTLNRNDILVGTHFCTYQGPAHLYWNLPYYSSGGIEANLFTYLLLWFLPCIFEENGMLKLSIWLFQIIFIQFFVYLPSELPSFWCALSIPILFLSFWHKKPQPSLFSF